MTHASSLPDQPGHLLPEPIIERQLAFGYEDAAGHLAQAAAQQLPVDVDSVLRPLPPEPESPGPASAPVVARLRV